jgi:hypothetical protein
MAFALGLFMLLMMPGSSFAGLRTTKSTVRGVMGGAGGGRRLLLRLKAL